MGKNSSNKSNSNNNNKNNNRVFLLDIRNDSCNPIGNRNNLTNNPNQLASSARATASNSIASPGASSASKPNAGGGSTRGVNNHHHHHHASAITPRNGNGETLIHRRIIEMYKCRDEFEIVDLNVRTSQPLSGHTRVDIANALQHMKNKCGKTLRRISADIDYVDMSVHEFVLLHCLSFDEISITSNPEEQTRLTEGLVMSLRHALTANKKCVKFLEVAHCTLSDETSGILCDGIDNSYSLETLRIALNPPNMNRLQRRFVPTLLQGLIGKKKLTELHLSGANSQDLMVSSDGTNNPNCSLLGELLSHKSCSMKDLYLGYDWNLTFGDTHRLFRPFSNPFSSYSTSTYNSSNNNSIRCESLLRLQFDGIEFTDNILPRELFVVFPNLETLSVSCKVMPKLTFLDVVDDELLPSKLERCYFPCESLDVEEGRKLIEKVPSITDLPDFHNDAIVQHYLAWSKCGRAKLRDITAKDAKILRDQSSSSKSATTNATTSSSSYHYKSSKKKEKTPFNRALWPLIFERANRIMKDIIINTSIVTMMNEEYSTTIHKGFSFLPKEYRDKNDDPDAAAARHPAEKLQRQASMVYSLLHDYERMAKNYHAIDQQLYIDSKKKEKKEKAEAAAKDTFWNRMVHPANIKTPGDNNDEEEEKKTEEEPAHNISGNDMFMMFGNQDNGDY